MPQGTVVSVCTSARRGVPKRSVAGAELRAGHGIDGDAHAGPGHRQLSLLDLGDIDAMRAKGLRLRDGAFGENLVVSGLDTRELGIGTRLRVGSEAVLEISQLGKVCHKPCTIYFQSGDCIMPRHGLFASVERGGRIAPGEPLRVLSLVPAAQLQAAVVGDGRVAAAAAVLLEGVAGARVAWRGPLPGGDVELPVQLAELCGRGLDVVVISGARAGAVAAELPPVPDLAAAAARGGLDYEAAGVCAGAVVVALRERAGEDSLPALLGELVAARARLRAAGIGTGGQRLPGTDEGAGGTIAAPSQAGRRRRGERA